MFDYAYSYDKDKPEQKVQGDVSLGKVTDIDVARASAVKVDTEHSVASRSALSGVEGLYKKYHRMLIGYLRNRLINKEEAEDVAQEVYYRLSRHSISSHSGISELEHPKAFVLQTAANLLVDINRVRARQQASHHIDVEEVQDQLLSEESNPEDITGQREALADIDRLLGELPPNCQAVFLMHRLEGATYSDIAETLGISVSMVEKHISKALLHLRTGMEVDHG